MNINADTGDNDIAFTYKIDTPSTTSDKLEYCNGSSHLKVN